MSILDFFPKGKTPRLQQADILTALEENWNKADLFVVTAPTGVGKSAISLTISSWLQKTQKEYTAILTPNNLLTQQYNTDYPKLQPYYGKDFQECRTEGVKSCGDYYKLMQESKAKTVYCSDCPYKKSHSRFRMPYPFSFVTNFYKYVQLKSSTNGMASRDNLIIDEAHLLIDSIKQFNRDYLWLHKFNYRKYRTRQELVSALERTVYSKDLEGGNVFGGILSKLSLSPPKYVVKETEEYYKKYIPEEKIWDRELRPQLQLEPITIKGLPNPLVNSGTKKIVLLSATISSKDIEELGLSGWRILYLTSDSCIPPENRPVYSEGDLSLNSSNLRSGTVSLVPSILKLAERYREDKGLIHATYAQAVILKQELQSNRRFIFHTKEDKREVYEKFKSTAGNQVLVASGMYEGIDLPYEAGRWQVLAKVPYSSLGEPAIQYLTRLDPEWYQWQAIKTVLQAAGRICRAPDDYGATHILDAAFNRLYSSNQELFPAWFKEAVLIKETEITDGK